MDGCAVVVSLRVFQGNELAADRTNHISVVFARHHFRRHKKPVQHVVLSIQDLGRNANLNIARLRSLRRYHGACEGSMRRFSDGTSRSCIDSKSGLRS